MKQNFSSLKACFSSAPPQAFDRGSDEFLVRGKMIKFPLHVESIIELQDRIIIGYGGSREIKQRYQDVEQWRAVFAYDFEGNVLWQVENPWYIDPETGKRIEYDNNNEKKFPGGDCVGSVLYNPRLKMIVAWGRVGYQLDTETGKLLAIVSRER